MHMFIVKWFISSLSSEYISLFIQIGFTSLHFTSQKGHTDVVELLIDHDAHIDVPTTVGVGVHVHYICNYRCISSVL